MANNSNNTMAAPNTNTTTPAIPLPAVRPPRQSLNPYGRQLELARFHADYEHRDYETWRIASGHGHENLYTPAALAALPKEQRLLVKRWPANWEAQLRRADCVFAMPAAGAFSHQLLKMLAIAARFVGPAEFKTLLADEFGAELAGKAKREVEKREVKAVVVKAAEGLRWGEAARKGLRE